MARASASTSAGGAPRKPWNRALVLSSRDHAKAHIAQQLHIHAARTQHQQRAQHRVPMYAENAFDAAFHHGCNQHAIDPCLRLRRMNLAQDGIEGQPGGLFVGHPQHHTAGIAFVQDVR
jgi:hypothetical protein